MWQFCFCIGPLKHEIHFDVKRIRPTSFPDISKAFVDMKSRFDVVLLCMANLSYARPTYDTKLNVRNNILLQDIAADESHTFVT